MASSTNAEVELRTQRRREKLAHEGHLYVFGKLSKDSLTEFWRCQYKNSVTRKCCARLHRSVTTGSITPIGIHSDMPNAANVEILQKKTALKRRAVESRETPQQIITKIRCNSSLAARGAMEVNKSLARIIQRERNRQGISPCSFESRADIRIPEEFCIYEDVPGETERFLLKDSGDDDPDRILIFGRESVASWIRGVRKVYVDGTFSLAPELFAQILVILGERPGSVVPLCYALLPNEREDTYKRVS